MTRIVNWPQVLNEYLISAQDKYREEGFQWGVFDCCVFTSDWVKLCTGIDVFETYRGQYTTREEGFDLLKTFEGSLFNALQNRLGDPVPPSLAHRGDIAFSEELQACGICIVQGSWMRAIFLGEGGFAIHRTQDCDFVFRVE